MKLDQNYYNFIMNLILIYVHFLLLYKYTFALITIYLIPT